MLVQRIFLLVFVLSISIFSQLDTAGLQDNRWVQVWDPATPLSISGNNWAYENDFQSHPFFGFFIMGPGHVIHPQDSYFYPYDPITNKWTKLHTAIRPPRS